MTSLGGTNVRIGGKACRWFVSPTQINRKRRTIRPLAPPVPGGCHDWRVFTSPTGNKRRRANG